MIGSMISTILGATKEGGGSITGLLILIIPMGAILYMTIMPQRKQRQKQADMLRKLQVGDEVLTTGGIVGQITFIEDGLYHIEIDNDVVVRIAKSAVSKHLAEPTEAEKPAAKGRKGLLEGALGGQSKAADSDKPAVDRASSDSK
ncbi:MAG: preprotein translocase subunit YajC [Microthrixaceae bacterium]